MKQIIPFQKEIIFRTMIGEITSISLEHTLSFENSTTIHGNFIVSGTYKMTEASQIEEDFDYHLPVDIEVSEHYDIKNSKIEIDDFYYEVINDEVLKVNIDVLLDGVEEEIMPKKEEISLDEEVIRKHLEKEEIKAELIREKDILENEIPILETELSQDNYEIKQNETSHNSSINDNQISKQETQKNSSQSINSIFSCFKDSDETFSTYSIYIVRENDTLEEIMNRYHCTKDDLSNYNNLDELTLGTKLIIPASIISDV